MKFQNFFTGWLWNLLIGAINILAYFGVSSEIAINYLKNLEAQKVVEIFFLVLAIFFFLRAIFVKSKGLNINEIVLRDIAINAKNKEITLWDYEKYGRSVLQTNYTWQELISGLLKTTERPDLDYYNFGEEYYFYDLENGKKIEIPTGNQVRTSRVGDTLRNGLVLRLMKKI
jgi:hypothetical protein